MLFRSTPHCDSTAPPPQVPKPDPDDPSAPSLETGQERRWCLGPGKEGQVEGPGGRSGWGSARTRWAGQQEGEGWWWSGQAGLHPQAP